MTASNPAKPEAPRCEFHPSHTTGPQGAQIAAFLPRDPGYYQISFSSALLIYGVGGRAFDLAWTKLITLLGTVLPANISAVWSIATPGSST